jgi:hypothetical protein
MKITRAICGTCGHSSFDHEDYARHDLKACWLPNCDCKQWIYKEVITECNQEPQIKLDSITEM